jgi:hypothetical protein
MDVLSHHVAAYADPKNPTSVRRLLFTRFCGAQRRPETLEGAPAPRKPLRLIAPRVARGRCRSRVSLYARDEPSELES